VNEPLFQDVAIHSLQAAVLHLCDILYLWVAGIMLLATDDILIHPSFFSFTKESIDNAATEETCRHLNVAARAGSDPLGQC
jgi:hypothetical protein